MERCENCCELYDTSYGMCPHCGYAHGDGAKEVYHLKPGTRLKNDEGKEYVIGKSVGQGGFGIVYKAWDDALKRVVAIKEFFPLSMASRDEGETQISVSAKRGWEYTKHLEKFRREAKIMSNFSESENCIETYDRFDGNGTSYIVMEYFDAPTLKSYIKGRKGAPLSEKEIIAIISQVLSGLKEIHAKGVYHLDIALDNIFIKKNEKNAEELKVRVYDFGAAHYENEKRSFNDDEIVLKPGFSPPEQYKRNGKLGPWSDIYAVGANMYYLLTGEVPLEATDREFEDSMKEPSQLAAVSEPISNVTMRAMALNPELRYQSAEEFLKDLGNEKARSDKEELERRKKIRRRFVVTVSLVTLLMAAALWGVWVLKGKIHQDKITMWVVTDLDRETERTRYQEIIQAFQIYYPQIDVTLSVMSPEELELKFVGASKNDRPDLLETTYASEGVLAECSSLTWLLEENEDVFVSGLSEKIISQNKKQLPLGMYATVIYKQSGAELETLSRVDEYDFITKANGYIENDTTLYSMIQKNLAGRYEVVPDEKKEVSLAEVFSIYSRSINKSKAAKALISYMLTDAAQEKMHISNRSDYLPVSDTVFELYVESVFSELDFLGDTLQQYEIK